MAKRPTPVRRTFGQAPRHSGSAHHTSWSRCAQHIPDDLENGFGMLGELRRGPGWRDRDDNRYETPSTIERLGHDNLEYVRWKTPTPRPGPHDNVMLDELVQETRLKIGRVIGPAQAPDHWPVTTRAPSTTSPTWTLCRSPRPEMPSPRSPLLCYPSQNETGNVMACRGTLASLRTQRHRPHHTVGDFAHVAHRLFAKRRTHVFGHDQCDSCNATFLHTRCGVTLWFHLAMCFGVAASVWNFDRAAGRTPSNS